MPEIILNSQFAELLESHGVSVNVGEEFIQTNLSKNARFKARAEYSISGGIINSRFDVMALTDLEECIIESVGDVGVTLEEAIERNFQNFTAGSFHPLLASLGCLDPHCYGQISVEEWEINGIMWKVYLGNLVPKIVSSSKRPAAPPYQFFEKVESAIKAQKLSNRMHWFRAYYSQVENEISHVEFLMDNGLHADTDRILSSMPVIPQARFYSCRIFIVLKNMLFE